MQLLLLSLFFGIGHQSNYGHSSAGVIITVGDKALTSYLIPQGQNLGPILEGEMEGGGEEPEGESGTGFQQLSLFSTSGMQESFPLSILPVNCKTACCYFNILKKSPIWSLFFDSKCLGSRGNLQKNSFFCCCFIKKSILQYQTLPESETSHLELVMAVCKFYPNNIVLGRVSSMCFFFLLILMNICLGNYFIFEKENCGEKLMGGSCCSCTDVVER